LSEPDTATVDINGFPTRIWRKGSGPLLGFLAGFGGLPRWVPFLDRLAERRTVVVPSLPGFPGGDRGHSVLDSHLDWLLATRHLLQAAGLDGADLAGSSVGASLAAEMAAVWPQSVKRLALIAPFGLFDEQDPPQEPLGAGRPDVLRRAAHRRPGDLESAEGDARGRQLRGMAGGADRAAEAAARIFWPLGDTRLAKRPAAGEGAAAAALGQQDRLVPSSYARRFANGSRPRKRKQRQSVPAAAQPRPNSNRPDEVARAVLDWTN
jgi:pimeloyl-ACP methyl ester carboxylesterase